MLSGKYDQFCVLIWWTFGFKQHHLFAVFHCQVCFLHMWMMPARKFQFYPCRSAVFSTCWLLPEVSSFLFSTCDVCPVRRGGVFRTLTADRCTARHLIKIWPVEKSQWSRQVMITCWDRWCFDQQQLYRIVRYRKWQTGSPICPCSNTARMQRNLRENNCKYLMSF